MPTCTIHLVTLHSPESASSFISNLGKLSGNEVPRLLVAAKPLRWIITPTNPALAPPLLAHNWDLFLVLVGSDGLPHESLKSIQSEWTTAVGVPSRLTWDFTSSTNLALLRQTLESEKGKLTGALENPRMASSAQGLEMSRKLRAWIEEMTSPSNGSGRGAVSMFNLLAFKPGMKESYMKYGKAFAESIGSRRGGVAKLVGSVIPPSSPTPPNKDKWDEFALAHYPSLLHFADMLSSEDYQEANHKWRLPALHDTCILCTTEVEIFTEANRKAKL